MLLSILYQNSPSFFLSFLTPFLAFSPMSPVHSPTATWRVIPNVTDSPSLEHAPDTLQARTSTVH